MRTFADILAKWQPFYSTLATACATLTGLIFVALSTNASIVRRTENSGLVAIARLVFGELVMVLMVSLIFLVPNQQPLGLAVPLIILGAAWTVGSIWLRGRQKSGKYKISKLMTPRVSQLGGLGILAAGVALLGRRWAAFYWLVFMLGALLASAAVNSWFLLIQVPKEPRGS